VQVIILWSWDAVRNAVFIKWDAVRNAVFIKYWKLAAKFMGPDDDAGIDYK
jgi:hypothetical protein